MIDAGLSPKTPPGRAGQLARLRKHLARLDANLAAEREELARRQTVVEAFANRLSQLRAELDMLPDGKHDDDAPAVVPISAAKAPAAGPAQSSVAAKLNTFALAVELRATREAARAGVVAGAARMR